MHCMVSNMEASSETKSCSENFSKLKVDGLKHYLRERGIQLTMVGKEKGKLNCLIYARKQRQ